MTLRQDHVGGVGDPQARKVRIVARDLPGPGEVRGSEGLQLASALDYYGAYPEEIDARLEREERWTPEGLWREHPFMRPDRNDNVGRGRHGSS